MEEIDITKELKKFQASKIINHGKCDGLNAYSYEVSHYSALVYLVSVLSAANQNKLLLFRGQQQRYPQNGKLAFLPTLYRNVNTMEELNEKIAKLEKASNLLANAVSLDYVDEQNKEQVCHCFIQHYHETLNVGTPFLDLTQSLRVAYSFISEIDKTNTGYVYVFGLPHTQGLITQNEEITLVRLMSLSSSLTLLPPLQEGYLVKYNSKPKNCDEISSYDFNKHLIAEIKVTGLNASEYWRIISPESLEKNPHDPLKEEIKRIACLLKLNY